MLRLSKRTLYVLEAVLDIACNARPNPVQSRDIAERQGIPQRYLEGAMQHLVRAGILRGVRGPRGGYRLARERRRVSLGDVVRGVQSMEPATDGLDEESGSELAQNVVRPLWKGLNDHIMERLDETSIDDLCLRAEKAGIASEGRDNLDFTI